MLEAAHARGVIHRDIKPENILITTNGAVLTDFGLGMILNAPHLTTEGQLVGSVETMPPEQLGGRPIDPRVDIYALGATLFYLSTGRQYLPFTENLARNVRLVLDRWGFIVPHMLNPTIPTELSEIIVRCLAPDPEQRYQGAGELHKALEGAPSTEIAASSPMVHSNMLLGIPRRVPDAIPTGAISLDIALGIGGWPRGHITEIYGPSGAGKTTLATHAIAEAQRLGGTAALIDSDYAINPFVAERCGVNIDSVYFYRPTSLEDAIEFIEELVRSNTVDIIIVDSVAALLSRSRFDGELSYSQGDDEMQNQILKVGLRRILVHLDRSKAALLFTNQLDAKVGVMFGNPETTAFGTHVLGYFASIRVDIRPVDVIKDGEDLIGNRTRLRIKKNRLAAPYKKAEFDIFFDGGISREGDLLDVGTELKVVAKKGGFLFHGNNQLGRGRGNARHFLIRHRQIAAAIDREIRERVLASDHTRASPSIARKRRTVKTDDMDESDDS